MKRAPMLLVLWLMSLPAFPQIPPAALETLPQAKDYVQHRSSSYDRTGGNADFRALAPVRHLACSTRTDPGSLRTSGSRLPVTIPTT